MDQCRDALRMLGVGEAFKEAVGRAEHGKSHFGPVDEGRETLVMAFAGFAEEHSLNAATGTQRFFDEPDALNADESVFRGQAAAQSHAELLEPAIVAAGKECHFVRGTNVARNLSRRTHPRGG